jgi:hypothetical protein
MQAAWATLGASQASQSLLSTGIAPLLTVSAVVLSDSLPSCLPPPPPGAVPLPCSLKVHRNSVEAVRQLLAADADANLQEAESGW